jgi:stress responsive alpha/beta barrel protein
MLTHIVVWKYRQEISEEIRQEHRAMLRSLSNIVPGIESFSVGSDILHAPRSYDTGLAAVFRDRSVLDAYTVHPDHVKAVEFGHSVIETMAKADFED